MRTKRRVTTLVSCLAALSLVAAGCGDDDDDNGSAGGDNGGSGGGTVDISGSSTVLPVSILVGEAYEASGSNAVVNVDGPGTGDGFALFCDGETDVSDASRPITEEEIATCEENGIEYVELYIAIDGLSVITNPENNVECLNFADLYALTGPESQGFTTWGDAQDLAAELGSDTELPGDAPLDITAPGEESGTYDSYVEIVLEGFADERGEDAASRPDYQSSGDDNVILQGIQGSATSFGWVGFAYFVESGGAVKAVQIAEEPGGECVEPNPDTIASGEYPISRPLFIYVNAERAESNEALAPFIDFYLSDEGIASVEEAGYIDIPDEDIEATREAWESRTTGATFAGGG
ncbi:MAG: PstS family phosphate ABC transporter substrate-binding protein [Acidimicrobiales bacterium]